MSAFALDPLIAAAKHRTRRRRGGLILALIAAAAFVAYGLGSGGRPGGGARASQSASSHESFAHPVVPIDATEREWRHKLLTLERSVSSPAAAQRLRAQALASVRATGAVPVRIRIWRRTSPAGLEVVAATRMNAAAYLRHRAETFVTAFGGSHPVYAKVVDPSGSLIFEWGGAGNEGFVGTAPGLDRRSPVSHWGLTAPPCPVN